MSTPIFDRLAIIGLGHMGASIALGARKRGLINSIYGFARSKKTREAASELGLCDKVCENAAQAVQDADLTILCVPIGATASVMEDIAGSLKAGSVLSDVGSVKNYVIEQVGKRLPEGVHFVPAHPLAGTENSGPYSGLSELFVGRWCLLTPDDKTDPEALAKVTAFWSKLGAAVEQISADHHDRVLAITSHLPHLIAYTIVGTATDLESIEEAEVVRYSATGFRDFTRIAASDPTMWADIFVNNRSAVLDLLGRFTEDLTAMQRAVRDGKHKMLFDHFTRTRHIRREIIEAGQDIDIANFGRDAVHSVEGEVEQKAIRQKEIGQKPTAEK